MRSQGLILSKMGAYGSISAASWLLIAISKVREDSRVVGLASFLGVTDYTLQIVWLQDPGYQPPSRRPTKSYKGYKAAKSMESTWLQRRKVYGVNMDTSVFLLVSN